MQFKTDENLHPELAASIRGYGHDATTVWDEGLRGVADTDLAKICRDEGRALVTLDLDFADIRRYPPDEYPGLIVLRVARQDRRYLVSVLERVMTLLEHQPLAEHLWIVDDESVRIRGEDLPTDQ